MPKVTKKINIFGNKLLDWSYFLYISGALTSIIAFVAYNQGYIKKDNLFFSTIILKTKEAVKTNFTESDFNTTYVKKSQFKDYNRVWDRIDYARTYPNEIHIMTNMAITNNQVRGFCADNPIQPGVECDPKGNTCVKGLQTQNGVLTGKCVKQDFPLNSTYQINNGSACEMEGWCPADRMIVPLNNYRGVLENTKNISLYISNALEFPNTEIILNNMFKRQCLYHPENDPYCHIFTLKDIIENIPNSNTTYEEMAKFGGSVAIKINWDCILSLFSTFDCKPQYSFRRTDVWHNYSHSQYYFDESVSPDGTSRRLVRNFRIKFEVQVKASLSTYDFYYFITVSSAYTGLFSVFIYIFEAMVRRRYKKYILDEQVNLATNEQGQYNDLDDQDDSSLDEQTNNSQNND